MTLSNLRIATDVCIIHKRTDNALLTIAFRSVFELLQGSFFNEKSSHGH